MVCQPEAARKSCASGRLNVSIGRKNNSTSVPSGSAAGFAAYFSVAVTVAMLSRFSAQYDLRSDFDVGRQRVIHTAVFLVGKLNRALQLVLRIRSQSLDFVDQSNRGVTPRWLLGTVAVGTNHQSRQRHAHLPEYVHDIGRRARNQRDQHGLYRRDGDLGVSVDSHLDATDRTAVKHEALLLPLELYLHVSHYGASVTGAELPPASF